MSLAEAPPTGEVPKRGKGKPRGPLAKIPCPNCGDLVTKGRMGREHETGECKKKKQLPQPSSAAVRPQGPISYQGDDIPSLDDIEGPPTDPAEGGDDTSPPEGAGPPPLDLSIIAEVMDPSVVKPMIEVVPNAVIAWKLPHSTTRADYSTKQVNGLIRFLPYILPRMMVNPFGLLALYLAFLWGAPLAAAFAEERRWQAENKKREHANPPQGSGAKAEGATA